MIFTTLLLISAAATYDPWTVSPTDSPQDRLVIDPASATLMRRDEVAVEIDYYQGDQLTMRRTLSVTGCARLAGTIALVDDDAGFGVQHWTANNSHTYDLLAVRACSAIRLKQEKNSI